ncbi:probable LRR receptor-like serine/threonine-protein kinase At1g53440 isoform X1 [Zingiber officinale]|uniref:probable LRR receptor-like serine/threonine-protein kinase At1g53440 isoform X1 n=2 Tax=Zingiber officinale TaxID=94328 RepID=UPI001C4BED4C|nr:probable LRR receptor-like serine/threonine-protein kinase At1g53440 isoform X1 [Zingiber officinale]
MRGMTAATAFKLSPHRLLVLSSLLLALGSFLDLRCRAQTQRLVDSEVEVLRTIGSKLNKNWNFSVDPCSKAPGWVDPENKTANYANNVTCGMCNTTTNDCHVTSILLKAQNLNGELPAEFANLTFLDTLDLARNYLNGTIPVKWGTLRLTDLTLLGNRISGRIPEEIGNITSLTSLVLEANLLEGSIPEGLDNLSNLTRLFLSSNNLTGELPESLGNLRNLKDFRIDGNPISGRIPSFIGNWTNLQRFDMQGTSMEGPFPRSFSSLVSITELRVTDWKGGDGQFPQLQNMTNMTKLVLRNLSISGEIPYYIGTMKSLNTLDLSFNNLTGQIPSSFGELNLNYMYLTNNKLSGSIPQWVLTSTQNLDVSYNSFNVSPPRSCQPRDGVNLVSSFSTNENSIASCLRKNLPCSGKSKNCELFINCGGKKVTINGHEYQDDSSGNFDHSTFRESNNGAWAYSNTGDFIGEDKTSFIAENSSILNMSNPELYTTARLSPLSMKYYGLCLQKGNYTVSLHFAEIMLTDDQTYASTGRRLFDVSIQGQKVLQDFNIAKEANGTGKVHIRNFTTLVNDTLEIHFQWGGKGTNSIPVRNVYGPLISAISITPNFEADCKDKSKLSVGVIVGIVIASCLALILALNIIWFYFIRKDPRDNELKGLELQTGYFTLKQIKAATRNFDPENKIGEGGFGPVYKGVLPEGSIIAVKQLSSKSRQGNREFVNEIGMISALQHPNLVKLYGCCIEGNQLLLIYEYMENNSLARALFGPLKYRLNLEWQTRRNICIGIARGLSYLHEESRLKIVHRDIKATNILLGKDLNAKISDFGLARLDEEENTHISTRIAGTIGYMAPEYAMRGYLTDKADVYSFGVVTLEIVSGISNTNYRPKEEFVYLLDWAYVLQEQGNLLELVDQSLGSNYSKEEALQMLELSLVCTNPSPTLRPAMSSVISMLEGKMPVKVMLTNRAASTVENVRFKALEMVSHDSQSQSSVDGPSIDSSISASSGKNSQAKTSHPLLNDTD